MINHNIQEVMTYNNVSEKEAVELLITDVIENVIRFVDKIDKPDVDYIRVLLEENNWDVMKCVDILEKEEEEWKRLKDCMIPTPIREVMKYGNMSKEKAIKSMISDVRQMVKNYQWKVCRCEYWKPLESNKIHKMLEKYNWDVIKCVNVIKCN